MKNIFTYLLLFSASICFGQDIHFSQITRANFLINPAFTGCFQGTVKAEMNFKDQWQSIDKTFRTYGASAEFALGNRGYRRKAAHFGFGAHLFKDVAGDLEIGNTTVGGSFSTLISVSRKTRFVLGLQANYTSIGINPSQMQWGDQYNGLTYDPSLFNNEGIDFRPFSFFDLGTGIALWFHEKDNRLVANSPKDAKIGFAVFHANRPTYSYHFTDNSKLPMRFVLHGDMTFVIHQDLYLSPNININYQNKQHEVILGSLLKYRLKSSSKSTGFSKEWIASAGLNLRVTNVLDAVIPQIFLNIEDFSLGLSYDVNVSKLNKASIYRGGFEISLRYKNASSLFHKNPFKQPIII